jgi:hypothetical protein
MKALKTIGFCLLCATVFLAAAVASSALRAKYSLVPQLKSTDAYMYATNLDRYSFLQYNQASPDRGQHALLDYLKLLERIRAEGIEYPQPVLHRDFGLTYIRLYRLALRNANSAAADTYMKSAQREFSALGWKDVSAEALTKYLETLESNEQKLYNSSEIQDSAARAGNHAPKGPSE